MPVPRRRLAFLAAAVVFLPVLVVLILLLPAVQRALAVRALDSVRASSGLDISFRDVRVSFRRLAVVVDDLRATAVAHPGRPLLVADRAEVDLARIVLTSRGRTVHIEHLRLDGPTLTLHRAADGTWNLPPTAPSAPDAETPAFALDHVEIHGGRVRLDDELQSQALSLSDLTVTTRAPGSFAVAATIQARLAEARWDGTLAGGLRLDGTRASWDDARLSLAGSRLATSGTFDIETGATTLQAEAAVAAADLADVTGIAGLAGTLRATASMTGTSAAPAVDWTVVLEDVTDGVLPPTRARGAGHATLARVDVQSLSGMTASGRWSADGRVGLTPDETTRLTLALAGLRLPEVLRVYAPAAPVDGIADGRASLEGPGPDWRDWRASARVTLRAPSSPRPGLVPVDGLVRAQLADGTWALDVNLAASAAVAVSALAGDLPTPSSDGSVRGTLRIDVDDLAAAASAFTGTAIDIAGRGTVDVRVAGTLAAPSATWGLDATASTSQLAPLIVTAAGTATLDALRAEDLRVTRGANALHATAVIPLGEGARLSGTYAADLRDLESLLAEPTQLEWPLRGGVTAEGTFAGTLDEPSVQARLTASGISMAGQQLDQANAVVSLRGSRVAMTDIDARSGSGRATGRIDIDLTRERHQAALTMTDWPVRDLPAGATQPAQALSARIDAAVTSAGSWWQPSGSATVTVRDATWESRALPRVVLRASADGAHADAELDAGAWGTTLRGRVTYAQGYPFDLTGAIDLRSLDPVRPWMPAAFGNIEGSVAARMSAAGHAATPASASVSLQLDALSLALDEARLALVSPATLNARGRMVHVDALTLRTGDATARVSGAFGETPQQTPLTIAIDGPLASAQPWLEAFAVEAPRAEGAMMATLVVGGTLARPQVSADLAVADLRVGLETFVATTTTDAAALDLQVADLHATLADGVLTLDETTATWQHASITASARVPLRLLRPSVDATWHPWLGDASGTAVLAARTTTIDTRVLQPFVAPGTLDGISGEVAAVLDLEADGPTLSDVSGQLVLETATFRLSGLPLAQARPTTIRLDAGEIVIRDVLFSGPNTDLSLDGFADVTGDTPTFDVQLRGLTDLALLRPFITDMVPGGRAEIDLRATGTPDAPDVTGALVLTDASLRLADPRLAIELLNGTATFTGRQMRLPALTGIANGAPATLSAALVLGRDNVVGGQVRVRASGLPLEYPEGMRTESDVDVLASIAGSRVDVTGTVDVLRGSYRDPIALSALTTGLLSSAPVRVTGAEDALPFDVRFDVRVETREDVSVDNNYGRFAAGGAVRLIGTYEAPALSGRLTLREGGELYLSGLTYRIDRGIVDFANPLMIEPVIDLAAETRSRGERVRIEATGSPETLEVTLSAPDADTPPSQAELASLLVSGRSLDDLSGMAAGEQALGLLSADLLGVVGRGIGLDALRLDRDLLIDDRAGTGEVDVAAETDPVARLTLAKRLRANVEVVFSQNLRNASEITWLVTWTPWRRTELRFLQRDDRSTSYEFRREVVFGAPPAPPRTRETPVRVRTATLASDAPDMTAALERRLSLDAGDRFDFYRWQQDRDRLEAWLHAERYYEHRIIARRQMADDEAGPVVDLHYEVTTGPRASLEVEGVSLDARVLTRLREAWHGSVFDGFLQDDLARVAREALLERGHPLAAVTVTITSTPDGREKTARISVDAGPSLERRLVVAGLDGPLQPRFTAWLDEGAGQLAWLDAPRFHVAARTWLRNRGALDAEVELGGAARDGDVAVRTVLVREGAPYAIDRLVVSGVPDVRGQTVRDELGLSTGEPFDVLELGISRRTLERWYVAEGFRQVAVEVETTVRRDDRVVDVDVRVAEGARAVIVQTRVEGARVTQQTLLERALSQPFGRVASPQHLLAARKRLYDTGVLAAADVESAPVGPAVAAADGTLEQPVVVTGSVRELPRIRLRYGLAVNDDVLQDDAFRASASRRVTPGLSALLENRNLFGRALTGGLSGRYERARQTGRAFLTAPSLVGRDIRVQASAGVTRSRLIPDTATSPIDQRSDATVGLTQRLPGLDGLQLTYGYRFERSRTYDPANPDLFDITVTAPRLTSTVFVDRRDDVTAATRGWFHASTIEVSRGWVGSDFEFIKYYAQQTAFRPVGRAVLAGRAQLGLGRGFGGQDLLGSEQFSGGGAVSVRGYGESVLGEIDPILGIARGDGLVVVNGEVRMPIWRWVAGVAFVDGGGVFTRAGDMGLAGMRWGTGAGVRVGTPAGLLRVDVGVPLARRPIDKAWRVYVGLGHVF